MLCRIMRVEPIVYVGGRWLSRKITINHVVLPVKADDKEVHN